MLVPIDLDHETSVEAYEIKNVVLEWRLSPELEVDKAPIAKQAPHGVLRVRGRTPHAPRVGAQPYIHNLMTDVRRQGPLTRLGPEARATFSQPKSDVSDFGQP
jgi:hypothetical protein